MEAIYQMQPSSRLLSCVRESGPIILRRLPNHKRPQMLDALVDLGHVAGFIAKTDNETTLTPEGALLRFEQWEQENLLPDARLATMVPSLLKLFKNAEIHAFGIAKGIDMSRTGAPDRNKDKKVARIFRALNDRCTAAVAEAREADRVVAFFSEMAFGRD